MRLRQDLLSDNCRLTETKKSMAKPTDKRNVYQTLGRYGTTTLLTLTMACVPTPSVSAAADYDETRVVMYRIFDNMRELLPLSRSKQRFASTSNQSSIRNAVNEIGANAVALEMHAQQRGGDAGSEFLAAALKRTARTALRNFEVGNLEAARSAIWNATRVCMTCHARLPSVGDSGIVRDFVDEADFTGLSVPERVQVQLATRQFDAALKDLEDLLASRDYEASQLVRWLTNYLLISIRVKGDLHRPLPVLASFALREDVWQGLRSDIEQWIVRLHQLAQATRPEPTLEAARALIDDARQRGVVPYSRAPMIDYVMASSLLQKYLQQRTVRGEALAQIYYMLAITEIGIGDNYILNQAEHYLESSVRAAPATPIAAQAFALLEEHVLFSFTGSSGTHLPDDVQRMLDEYRLLAHPGVTIE